MSSTSNSPTGRIVTGGPALQTYGSIPNLTAKALAKSMLEHMNGLRFSALSQSEVLPLHNIRLRSKKRKGKHRVYLLWIDSVFMGEFRSNKERRMFIEAHQILQEDKDGTLHHTGTVQFRPFKMG